MPQATEEQRQEWNGPDDATAIKFLEDAGYTLMRSWEWQLPTPDHKPSEKEVSAACFLIDEWDFGGILHHAMTVP